MKQAFVTLLAVIAASALQAAFAPTDISGLKLWLKADAGALNEQGTLADTDQRVTLWQDQSGQGNHVTNSWVSKAPTFKRVATGGFPAVSSTGGFWLDPPAEGVDGKAVFMVGALAPLPDVNANAVLTRVHGGGSTDIFLRNSVSDAISLDGTYTGTKSVGTVTLNGLPMRDPSNNLTGYQFNLPTNAFPSPFILHVTYANNQLFTQFMRRSTSIYYKGTISEVIIYDRDLTEVEANQIGAYLKTKYTIDCAYPDAEEVTLVNGVVDRIGDTSARLHYTLAGPAATASVQIRAYYGTTDAESDPDAWEFCDELPVPTAAGVYTHFTQQPLTVNQSYFCRFSITDGEKETFSSPSSFTTRPLNTPVVFRYVGEPYATNSWTNETQWVNLSAYHRTFPDCPGDQVEVLPASKNHDITQLIEQDVTLGNILYGFNTADLGGYYRIYNTNETPCTLTLDSGLPGLPVSISNYYGTAMIFGQTNTTQALAIRLNSPLSLTKTTANRVLYHFCTPISGGTFENPVPIHCTPTVMSAEIHLYFESTNNTFIGDITVDAGTLPSTVANLYAGRCVNPPFITSAHDGMFGHPTNRIILRNNALLVLHGASADTSYFGLERTICGTGRVYRVAQDSNHSNSKALSLHLGEKAVISPGEGDQMGHLTILSHALTSSGNSTLRVKVDPTASDTIYFDGRTAHSFTGRLDVVKSGKIPYGTTWTIATWDARAKPFTFNPSSITPHFSVNTVGESLVLRYTGHDFNKQTILSIQ